MAKTQNGKRPFLKTIPLVAVFFCSSLSSSEGKSDCGILRLRRWHQSALQIHRGVRAGSSRARSGTDAWPKR
eukprot:18282-Amphidinium_carterae.1